MSNHIPSCCRKQASELIRIANAIEKIEKQAAWENLPDGWTEESVKSFWDSLVGDVKHKVTKCIKKMKGKGMDDPGAFCASLRDRIEGKGWRSE